MVVNSRRLKPYLKWQTLSKQIYIFDELAADQDPGFRKHFYDVLLPGLKEQGKTIIFSLFFPLIDQMISHNNSNRIREVIGYNWFH